MTVRGALALGATDVESVREAIEGWGDGPTLRFRWAECPAFLHNVSALTTQKRRGPEERTREHSTLRYYSTPGNPVSAPSVVRRK